MEYENKQSKLFPYYKKLWHWGIKSLKVFVLIFTAFIILGVGTSIYEPFSPTSKYADKKIGFPFIINSCVLISLLLLFCGILKKSSLLMNQFKVIFLLFIFIKLGLDGFDVIYSIIKSVGNSSISDSFGLKNYYTYYRNSLIVKEFTINNLLSRVATHILAICIHVYYYLLTGSYINASKEYINY
ncbi:hypothetical protein H8356DRAFT_1745709 [Neocallimastix lanati (nom. inval.)]|nr:hypothetical protein H8356DRAFT_1745709 [Neocallimastix sp. JGI-2020a]